MEEKGRPMNVGGSACGKAGDETVKRRVKMRDLRVGRLL